MPTRLIKESICTSSNLNRLTPEEEILFYRIIVNCDDYGRFDARPDILRSRCFPLRLDVVPATKLMQWLGSLVKANLVHLYAEGDHYFLQVATWDRHQQIRAKRSKYPEPEPNGLNLKSSEIICNQLPANVTVIQSNPIRIQSESESITHEAPSGTEKKVSTRSKKAKATGLPSQEGKKPYGEHKNVLLTDEEYAKLGVRFNGQRDAKIEKLSSGKAANKKYKYDSDYAAVINWATRDAERTGGAHGPSGRDSDKGTGNLSDEEAMRLGPNKTLFS